MSAIDWRKQYEKLRESLAEISDLGSASALLHWDQETYLPRGTNGIDGRSTVIATLASTIHAKSTAPELRDLVQSLNDSEAAGSLSERERAMVRLAHRDIDRSSRVEARIVREIAEASSRGQAVWAAARNADRFVDFAPHLARLLDLKREAAEQLGYQDSPLDALLEDYEPGATVKTLATLFSNLEPELKQLVAKIAASTTRLDPSPLLRRVAVDRQREFTLVVAKAMGFDFENGRLDISAHPFTQKIHKGDVRLTWHFAEGDLRPGFFAVVHEAGHGIYEQGLPEEWERSPLAEATSYGMHESQSRFWENMIARSRPFWRHFLPHLKKLANGALDDVDVEAMYRAANVVTPSLIRIEADELTYNLHIALRFAIERELFAGRLEVNDIPAAWRARMHDLLGIEPKTDREGCLQDIHWSMGAFGYFPTYTLGNLYAAQLVAAADRDLNGIDAMLERGELLPLRDWMREKVHGKGRQFTAAELVQQATGEAPSARFFLEYSKKKYGELYRI